MFSTGKCGLTAGVDCDHVAKARRERVWWAAEVATLHHRMIIEAQIGDAYCKTILTMGVNKRQMDKDKNYAMLAALCSELRNACIVGRIRSKWVEDPSLSIIFNVDSFATAQRTCSLHPRSPPESAHRFEFVDIMNVAVSKLHPVAQVHAENRGWTVTGL